MKNRFLLTILIIVGLLLCTTSSVAAPGATPISTAFTYQGQLNRDGEPYTGICDFQFKLWDAESSGNEIGSVNFINDQSVIEGLFTIKLDFGTEAFGGQQRWLEIAINCPGDSGWTILERQELTAAPYATYAEESSWYGISDIPLDFADGVDNDTVYSAGYGLDLSDNIFSIDTHMFPQNLHTSTLLDDFGDVGLYSSIIIGSDGYPLISYHDQTLGDLKVAHCHDFLCTTATVVTVDSTDVDDGEGTSITVGSDGFGLISYYDNSNHDLKIAHCNDLDCSTSSIYKADETGDVGRYSSITTGSDGLGIVSYYDHTNIDLKVAHCEDQNCSTTSKSIIDTSAGINTSITIGKDGLPLISTNHIIVHCNDLKCISRSITTIPGTDPYTTSVTIGTDGFGLVCAVNDFYATLLLLHCTNSSCSSFGLTNYSDFTGDNCSIITGINGFGLFSSVDPLRHDLLVGSCLNFACTSISTIIAEPFVDAGQNSSIAIGKDSQVVISFYDSSSMGIRVSHCSNSLCIPETSAR